MDIFSLGFILGHKIMDVVIKDFSIRGFDARMVLMKTIKITNKYCFLLISGLLWVRMKAHLLERCSLFKCVWICFDECAFCMFECIGQQCCCWAPTDWLFFCQIYFCYSTGEPVCLCCCVSMVLYFNRNVCKVFTKVGKHEKKFFCFSFKSVK